MRLVRRLALPLTALFLLILLPLRQRNRRLALKRSGWTELRLAGEVVELQPARDVTQAFVRRLLKRKDPPRVVLTRLRKFVNEMRSDSYAKGVLVRVGALQGGWAACEAIRTELIKLREAGRHVVIHLESNVDNRQALIAGAGTHVSMTPVASLAAVGSAAPGLFLRDALDQVGLKVEAIGHGKYKSAPDQFTRVDRSPEDAEQAQALIDQFDDALLESLMAGRVLNRTDAEGLVDAAPMIGQRAREAGFCDSVARDEDLGNTLKAIDERDEAPRPVGAGKYMSLRTVPPIWRSRRRHVGVVRVHGPIVDEPVGLPVPDQPMAVASTVVNDLRAALTDTNVGAVVMHINSRGGSVTASDVIYAAARRLDQEKPVIACFGDVSASGGYYVGCGARSIVASPLTVTGSIGVFGLLPTWNKATERWTIGHDVLKNRRNAAMYNPWAGLDPDAKAHAQREVTASYEMFVSLVAASRDLSTEDVEKVAQGRVWTGRDARQHRLLDDLGGFTAAVEQAKSAAGGRFAAEPVIVSARGTQPRPRPFDPDKPSDGKWFGETLLDGEARASSAVVPWLEALGLSAVDLDPVALELMALWLSMRGQHRILAYAPGI